MQKIAFLFPGQGSQYSGMGRELFESFSAARKVFETADEALEFPLSKLCFEGLEDDLIMTANTQPAVLAVSIAASEVLKENGIEPSYVAGHSLGECSAMVAAGAVGLSDGVRFVRRRGEYMQEAVPAGQGAMAAFLGTDAATTEEICRLAAQGEVLSVANLNSPAQIVIAGHATAVRRAVDMAERHGVRRAVMLKVSAPFHCALMRPAEERLARDLDRLEMRDPRVPLVNNVEAKIVRSAVEIRNGLKRQVSHSVRWEESLRKLLAEGTHSFIEVGPGKVLSGLLRQVDPDAHCLHVEDLASLNDTLEQLARTSRRLGAS